MKAIWLIAWILSAGFTAETRAGADALNTSVQQIASADKDCKGEGIRLSVAADAKSYIVSIPSTGFSKIYETRKHESW